MARIGIYGSSFDPITNVHLWTANTVAHRAKLDMVVFLPAADIHIKDKADMQEERRHSLHASAEHRWNMLQLALQSLRKNKRVKFVSDDYEMMSRAGIGKHYTYYTMKYFKEKYPDDEVFFIMGADLLQHLSSWKLGKELVEENRFIVMARDNIDMVRAIGRDPLLRNHSFGGKFELMDKGLSMEISSTYIREEFSMGGDPEHLLPDVCYDYILEHGLYQSKGNGR